MSQAAVATGLEDLNTSMNAFMGGLEAQLGKSLEPLKEISEKMGGSKFGKNVKAFGSAMKGMAGASVQAWAMEQLMKLIEPFMKLLTLLEIPINVLAALLTMFVNEIFVELLPFFLEFSLLLLELAPLFKVVGQILGKLLSGALTWLIEKIVQLWNAVKPLVLLLGEKLLPIWEKLKGFFEKFWEFLKNHFIGMWQGIKKAFEILKTAWEESGGKIFGKDGFIAKAFRGIFDFLKSIVNGVLNGINSVITKINDVTGFDIATIPLLAKGGFVTAPTLAMLGDNTTGVERVQPLENGGFGKESEMLAASEETNRLLNILIKQDRDRERFNGFGR